MNGSATMLFLALAGAYVLYMGRRASSAATPPVVWTRYAIGSAPAETRVRRVSPKKAAAAGALPWPTLEAPAASTGPGVILPPSGGGTWT